MNINKEKLRLPLNNFWISEPYARGRGFIGIGKLSEDDQSCLVTSPGEGIVKRIDQNFISLEHEVEGDIIKIELFNLSQIYVKENQKVERGEPLAQIVKPHLRVRAYRNKNGNTYQVNPLSVLYVYPEQTHRNHIPRHTPKPVPILRKKRSNVGNVGEHK